MKTSCGLRNIKRLMTRLSDICHRLRSWLLQGYRKSMKVYISASETTIGSMLAQDDEDRVERVIYYLSRALIDAEIKYSSIEKLCLALYFSCMKLKHYLIPCEIFVISQFNVIKYMFSSPILHNRVGKWMLALIKFSLHFVPAKAIKGQALADFLVDHPGPEIQVDIIETKSWKLFFDESRHEKGAGIGILLISPMEEPTKFLFELEKDCSNNEAEYEALIMGLEILIEKGIRNVELIGDS